MIVGIVGLGLIGGSFARAYGAAGHKVLVRERDRGALCKAVKAGAAGGVLTRENVSECDLVLICVYPGAAVKFLEDFGPYFGKKPLVMDCCGTKRETVRAGMALAEKTGFTFLGGHPMAGTQFSGFDASRANMYQGAPMVVVPPENGEPLNMERLSELLAPAGFGTITVTTAEKHDEIIAFTSQLAHVVSNAYVKSPSAQVHKGFSAGSYKDMTRVAWLNPKMWAELFLDNGDYLNREIDILIGNLKEYKDAIEVRDEERLIRLLDEGKRRKEELDG